MKDLSLDKTNFAQSLMHMIKGNLGTGILAMPVSFRHCGLIGASIGLPLLCLIATYCVHLLVTSSEHLSKKRGWEQLDYAELAKKSFIMGPSWMRKWSRIMCRLVDATLIISQMGICCVYVVFVVNNVEEILRSYNVAPENPRYLFVLIMPIVLLLSYIRTLRRLAIASALANGLQVVGLLIIIEYLLRPRTEEQIKEAASKIDYFRPAAEVAQGFGSAMFAFEGISVVLPIFRRMKRPEQMSGWFGIINISYMILLVLYFTIGFLGYQRYPDALGSITLNLPREPLYDVVRAIFTVSLLLTYPLQFYVPNEIIWNWIKARFLLDGYVDSAATAGGHDNSGAATHAETMLTAPTAKMPATALAIPQHPQEEAARDSKTLAEVQADYEMHEYLCRTVLVLISFALAYFVPYLDLLMEFAGSIAGTALSITLPAIIHVAAFWEDRTGLARLLLIVTDVSLLAFGLIASASGSFFSFIQIVEKIRGTAKH